MADEVKHKHAIIEMADCFVQFSRNGRWGTCVGCPRDVFNRAYPEFCPFTDRYDHQLTAESLADSWSRRLK